MSIYRRAVDLYGVEDRIERARKSLRALDRVLGHNLSRQSMEQAQDKMADVEIMLDQLKVFIGEGMLSKAEKLRVLHREVNGSDWQVYDDDGYAD